MAKQKVETKNEVVDLEPVISRFYSNNTQLKTLKTLTEADSALIKEAMQKQNIFNIVTADGVVADITITQSESFNEEQLLEFAKTLKIKGLVKKREYVDMTALEDAVYHGLVNAVDLQPFQVTRESTRLTVKKRK